jgi:GNAT superfamily N-acetyltransferase
MPLTVRPSTLADAESIGTLVAEFQAYLRGLGDRTSFDFDAAKYARDGFGDDPAFAGLVAESDGAAVGYALYHFGYDTDYGCRLVYLVDLYVREGRRRQGIGEALFRGVADAGRSRGAQAMLWTVYRPNVLALRFYERLGAEYIADTRDMFLNI